MSGFCSFTVVITDWYRGLVPWEPVIRGGQQLKARNSFAGRGAEVLIVGEYTAKAKMGRDKDGKVVKEAGGRPAPSFLL